MSRILKIIVGTVLVVGIAVVASSAFVVDKTDQVVITQFGDPVGEPITDEPGLHYKVPFIQDAHFFDNRYLEWEGYLGEIPTKDKRFIKADTYARWQIEDPLKFYKRVRTETRAQSRLDDIIDGATRDSVASNELLELVRATNRDPERDADLEKEERSTLEDISTGRPAIMNQIQKQVNLDAAALGIRVLDVRFKKINYNDQVREDVYNRMIAERKRIAERYRSEGEGEAADIRGQMERELDEISSKASKEAEQIRGRADGKVTEIYADAYQKDPEFYEFLRTMETYPDTLDKDSWLMMSTDSQYFKYLQQYRDDQ
jgi:membrane protease subunit HflC